MMVFALTKTLSPCFIRINEVFYFFDGGSRANNSGEEWNRPLRLIRINSSVRRTSKPFRLELPAGENGRPEISPRKQLFHKGITDIYKTGISCLRLREFPKYGQDSHCCGVFIFIISLTYQHVLFIFSAGKRNYNKKIIISG
jgi:hypothetical protein